MENERTPIPEFNFKDQMEELGQLIKKISDHKLDKYQEMYFLQTKEFKLQEEVKALNEKEDKILKEYGNILIEMGSELKIIKELKAFAMEERQNCANRFMELKNQEKEKDGTEATA